VGDPDRGFGQAQPGGWVYNVLPYLEQAELRRAGRHMDWDAKKAALEEVLKRPLAVFHCPSRRTARPYAFAAKRYPFRNAVTPPRVAKSDYAVSGGDTQVIAGPGPDSGRLADLQKYRWPDPRPVTGVTFVRTLIRPNQLRDGASHTYLIGEKYISVKEYNAADGGSGGDDQAMYIGDDADIRRWTESPPMPDARRLGTRHEFGSAHTGGCHFVLCDGSVHTIMYDVDAKVHRRLGNRHDGLGRVGP
jgi:hypothetical protein